MRRFRKSRGRSRSRDRRAEPDWSRREQDEDRSDDETTPAKGLSGAAGLGIPFLDPT